MSTTRTVEQVTEVVAAMAPRPRAAGVTVSADTELAAGLGYDSVRLIELSIALEQHFDLPPLDEAAPVAVRTVGDVVELVELAGRQRGAR